MTGVCPTGTSFAKPQKQFLLERYFPKLAVHNGRYSSIQQTQSCGKETPCGKSPSHLALGHRHCLIVSGFPRGCERPEMFSVADRQEKKPTPSFKQLRCMFSRFARRHIRCHEKDCNSCPHIHQRSRQDYVHQYPHWGEQACRKPLGQKGS